MREGSKGDGCIIKVTCGARVSEGEPRGDLTAREYDRTAPERGDSSPGRKGGKEGGGSGKEGLERRDWKGGKGGEGSGRETDGGREKGRGRE